jgi:tetratricopeptide (TPR) repeat protein
MLEQGKWAQSIESYKKAAEIDPKQIYAWQGIILNYERQNIKQHKDLLDAYKRVATFYEK